MRLFKSNTEYQEIIIQICNYMTDIMSKKFSDYSNLLGLSGANIGIPYNIIAFVKDDRINHMINPIVVAMSKKTKTKLSNCGSINLKDKCVVSRREWIAVEYYNINGVLEQKKFTLDECGGTIQHEICHNKGFLITDISNGM